MAHRHHAAGPTGIGMASGGQVLQGAVTGGDTLQLAKPNLSVSFLRLCHPDTALAAGTGACATTSLECAEPGDILGGLDDGAASLVFGSGSASTMVTGPGIPAGDAALYEALVPFGGAMGAGAGSSTSLCVAYGGLQTSLVHRPRPQYFAGENLFGLLTVRNAAPGATAQVVRVRAELVDAASQRPVRELLHTVMPTLASGASFDLRIVTRLNAATPLSLQVRVDCSTDPLPPHLQQQYGVAAVQQAQAVLADACRLQRLFPVDVTRGLEEHSRRVIRLPSPNPLVVVALNPKLGSESAEVGKSNGMHVQSAAPVQRFLVLFCLRNGSATESAALQHVRFVVSEAQGGQAKITLNAAESDPLMSSLLGQPVVSGAGHSSTAYDTLFGPGEVRQFGFVIDVTDPNAAGGVLLAAAVNAAAAAAGASGSGGAGGGANRLHLGTISSLQLGHVEWQWRRGAGDGGSMRSLAVEAPPLAVPPSGGGAGGGGGGAATALIAGGAATGSPPPTMQLAAPATPFGGSSEISVRPLGTEPALATTGVPCRLLYAVSNRSIIPTSVLAVVEPELLVPAFAFTGASTVLAAVSSGSSTSASGQGANSPSGGVTLSPGESAVFAVDVVPLRGGTFAAPHAVIVLDGMTRACLWAPSRGVHELLSATVVVV